MLKNLFNDIRLVNEADDAHLSLAFGTAKRVRFINFLIEVAPALFNFLGKRRASISLIRSNASMVSSGLPVRAGVAALSG